MASVLEKLKALDEQRSQLLDEAKAEALDIAEKAVAELNELGFHYTLSEGGAASPRGPRKAASTGGV
jgi:vacuolar-type H+-ATPase subunit H